MPVHLLSRPCLFTCSLAPVHRPLFDQLSSCPSVRLSICPCGLPWRASLERCNRYERGKAAHRWVGASVHRCALFRTPARGLGPPTFVACGYRAHESRVKVKLPGGRCAMRRALGEVRVSGSARGDATRTIATGYQSTLSCGQAWLRAVQLCNSATNLPSNPS
jgi:hypothetical protein